MTDAVVPLTLALAWVRLPMLVLGSHALHFGRAAVAIVAFGPGPDWSELPLVFAMMLAAYSILSVIGLAFVWAFYLKWRVRKNMRQISALSREQHLTWTETGFEIESSQGNTRFPYDEIHQWAANDTSVILYPADHLFFAFPKRIFESEAQASEFLAALESSPAKRI